MNKIRASITGLWIAFFIAACSDENTTTPSQGGSGGTDSTGSGGAAGSNHGGTAGNNRGGTAGGVYGGTTGNIGAGAGNGGSGTAGKGSGGTASSGNGGAAGKQASATTSDGGTQTDGGPGQGGSTSTDSSGGAQGTGGKQAGGAPGAGGSTQAGNSGSAVSKPQVVTSGEGAYWKEATWTEVTSGTVDVTVNDGTTYQTWSGFGGTFNEAGWDAMSLLTSEDRDRAMKLLFHATEGAHFLYGRVPIGASDYALDRYTLDENKDDFNMEKFSIDRDRKALIPYIQAALAINLDIHLWASPWTPPTWMKTGSYTADGKEGWDGGNMKDDDKTLTAYALYLARFVEEYAKERIKIEAIHPQNEPGYATRYPSCLWTASLFNKFIGTYLGPTFTARNLTAQVYLGTMSNNDSGKDGTIINTVLGDSTAMKYVKGAGLQWNMIDSVSTCTAKGLQVVQSEHKCGNYPWSPTGSPPFNPDKPPNDHAYGVESWGLIRDWINKGVHVYSAWNMVLDTAGKNLDTTRPWPQNSLLVVDRTAKTLTATPAYYVFRHVSQFLDSGAKRVEAKGSDALAFRNPDGSIVTIMYNSGGAKKAIVSVGGKKLQFDMPGNGWATVNWK